MQQNRGLCLLAQSCCTLTWCCQCELQTDIIISYSAGLKCRSRIRICHSSPLWWPFFFFFFSLYTLFYGLTIPPLFTSGSTQPPWRRLLIYSQLCRVDCQRLAVILIYFARRHEKRFDLCVEPSTPREVSLLRWGGGPGLKLQKKEKKKKTRLRKNNRWNLWNQQRCSCFIHRQMWWNHKSL